MPRLIATICLLAGLSGCAGPTATTCAPGSGSPLAVFTLFMGQAIPGRGDLTETEWESFVNETVNANLPNGYTLFDANGGWMNPATHKSTKESTKVLLVALPEAPDSLTAINRVRSVYQTRFRQQSVGMTVTHGCGEF